MANRKKKQKYPNDSKSLADAKRYSVKYGDYNGASSSDDFMVSGHSTGSPYSEMEELSEQLTRDVGGIPYRGVETQAGAASADYEGYEGEGLGDLGGPEFYGDKPSLLAKSPIHHAGTSRGLAMAAAVGLAATAVLGGLSYFFYQTSQKPARRRASGASASASTTKSAGASASASGSKKSSARSASTGVKAKSKARAPKAAGTRKTSSARRSSSINA